MQSTVWAERLTHGVSDLGLHPTNVQVHRHHLRPPRRHERQRRHLHRHRHIHQLPLSSRNDSRRGRHGDGGDELGVDQCTSLSSLFLPVFVGATDGANGDGGG